MGRLNDLTRSPIRWFGGGQAEVGLGAGHFEPIALQRRGTCQPHFINLVFVFIHWLVILLWG